MRLACPIRRPTTSSIYCWQHKIYVIQLQRSRTTTVVYLCICVRTFRLCRAGTRTCSTSQRGERKFWQRDQSTSQRENKTTVRKDRRQQSSNGTRNIDYSIPFGRLKTNASVVTTATSTTSMCVLELLLLRFVALHVGGCCTAMASSCGAGWCALVFTCNRTCREMIE